ncbi:hypothetical protein CMALT430_50005 [Carnobacterium maltaromaticum]|nr:hypothetical protein CMALT430_50005 [Carnobacterium maltaromaticum]
MKKILLFICIIGILILSVLLFSYATQKIRESITFSKTLNVYQKTSCQIVSGNSFLV